MDITEDNFKEIYTDYKRGNISNIYYIIEFSLYIVLIELLKLKEITKETINIGINSLINSIETYSYEKSCDFFTYSKKYINFCLKNQNIIEPLIEISKEKKDEYIERLEKCYKLLKESSVNNEKNKKNAIKMLLLSKKNGIL